MSTQLLTATDSNSTFARRSETMLSVALLAVIVVLLIPLPAMILDMLLAFNLAMSILLLLITLGARQPLEVSIFPSLLLLLTLYRLSLNVATTRLILLNGDAGKIVSTFGGFVVGGSLTVGIVIFLILVIIQFIVITKGASRISEVNARFVLDAMPGKQMAIDAELNSGAIDDVEAREKRSMLTREAEFFGAMDGAGKYVRGDAIAGLIITLINILGGIVFGMASGLSFSEAMKLYTTLTIGDGLLSQIPALVIATTAGILVTKASSGTSIGHELGLQMLARRQPLIVGAVIMFAISLTPGLPKLPFIALGIALVVYARRLPARATSEEQDKPVSSEAPKPAPEETGLEQFVNTDRIGLEIGSAIIPHTSVSGINSLPDRISAMRRELTHKYGMWIPVVRLRDSLNLDSRAYRVLINGREVGRGEIIPGQFMAIDPGTATLDLDGEPTVEPAFGLKALWVPASSRQRAELGGYTAVDALTVLITHLGELLRRHAHELLSREDMQKMLNKLRETAPTIVDELKPEVIRAAVLRRVLTNLLSEKVPIASLELILESAVHHGVSCKEPEVLTDRVREDIGHVICERFRTDEGNVRVIVIDPHLEQRLRNHLAEDRLVLSAGALESFIGELKKLWEPSLLKGEDVALLTDGSLRRPLRRVIERALPDLACISYAEIPGNLMIEPLAILRAESVFTDGGVVPAATNSPSNPEPAPVAASYSPAA
ncbi:MAG: flagellar biosynthesis protein FlhA [Pirellulaceae bacterium]